MNANLRAEDVETDLWGFLINEMNPWTNNLVRDHVSKNEVGVNQRKHHLLMLVFHMHVHILMHTNLHI